MTSQHVLVVDDDKEIREVLVDLLEDHGCAAVGAENGQRAMEMLLTGGRTCLIFLDLTMPVMDGSEFREEQVKCDGLRDIPVVVISALSDLKNKCAALNVAACLQKPLDAANVLDIARRYCRCTSAGA